MLQNARSGRKRSSMPLTERENFNSHRMADFRNGRRSRPTDRLPYVWSMVFRDRFPYQESDHAGCERAQAVSNDQPL